MNVQKTNLGLDINGTHQILIYADDINLVDNDIRATEKILIVNNK